ncbi:MAG TPA: hypothetical protein VHM31_00930 [Polyangia bacterium]|nr:hypothetical protein [Polyangia bacterium]
MEQTGFDPKRRLCPDGSCVGVISTDGRCTVCGMSAGAAGAGQPESAAGSQDAWGDDPPALDAEGAGIGGLELSAGFDPKRRLCDDGSCIGVIGADGACTVCGMRAGA